MNKNKIFCLILVTLLVLPMLCLTSCELNHGPQNQSAHFLAKVTEVHEKQLFVTVIDKGTSSLQNGSPAYVSTDFEGYTSVAVGDFVIVEYDTMVQEIYPPIIPNVFSITKADANGNPLK